ncbi:hypothetical protein NEPAR04_2000 [Nematocida parisii]|nr:hypothetical protein NEPAR03_1870 [Nematocida parisii]KAI5130128.1 hypothetical protein NEPAR08_1866 [Nematocida parisii]KAI5143919.1 hypothetical protein NEPAR04_2000 [Nematocida parisii]
MSHEISLISYGTSGAEDILQTKRITQHGIDYFYVNGEYVLVDGGTAGCTCSEYLICQHIISVARNEYSEDRNILKDIVQKVMNRQIKNT